MLDIREVMSISFSLVLSLSVSLGSTSVLSELQFWKQFILLFMFIKHCKMISRSLLFLCH